MDLKLFLQAAVCATVIASVSSFPFPQGGPPAGPLPIPREGQYGPDNYFQYINVPAHKTFEWGYRRGNPKHNREEYLSQKDHTFKAKVSQSIRHFIFLVTLFQKDFSVTKVTLESVLAVSLFVILFQKCQK